MSLAVLKKLAEPVNQMLVDAKSGDSDNNSDLSFFETLVAEISPPKKLKPSEWMEAHFKVTDGDKKGYIKFDGGYEYQRLLIDELFGDFKPGETVREGVVFKGSQSGITMSCRGGLLFWNVERRHSVAHMMPRQDDANTKAEELDQNIRADAYLRSVYRKSPNTEKRTKRGQYYRHVYSSSEDELVSFSSKVNVTDEYDRCEHTAFSSVGMFDKRQGGYARIIKIRIGTPTAPEFGVHELYLKSDKRVWMVPCAFCGHKQQLLWETNIEYDDTLDTDQKKAASAKLVCAKCRKPWDTHTRKKANALGEWVRTGDSPVIGFSMNRLMVPTGKPQEMVNNYLQGLQNDRLMKEHFNQDRGLPFFGATGILNDHRVRLFIDETLAWSAVPPDVRRVTCGIDVQGSKPPYSLVWEIRAYNKNNVRHVINYGKGFPDDLDLAIARIGKIHAGLADISSGIHKPFVLELCERYSWMQPARFDNYKKTNFTDGGRPQKVKRGHSGYALSVNETLDYNMSCFYTTPTEENPARIKIAANPNIGAEKIYVDHYTKLARVKDDRGDGHNELYRYVKQRSIDVDYPYAGALADYAYFHRKFDLPDSHAAGLGKKGKPVDKQKFRKPAETSQPKSSFTVKIKRRARKLRF